MTYWHTLHGTIPNPSEIQSFYLDEKTAFKQDVLWDFKSLVQVQHDAAPMSWVPSALDLNKEGLDYLYFIPAGHSFQAFHIDSVAQTSNPITWELHVDICNGVKSLCKGGVELVISQFTHPFPASSLINAFGIVYPQYWMNPEGEQSFERHFNIIKEHYGYSKAFQNPKAKKADKETTLPLADLVATSKTAETVISIAKLNEQVLLMFRITMKANCQGAMIGDLPLNPLTCLWRHLEASGLLYHKLSEYLKVVKLAVVTVLGSVEDEWTFSTVSLIKNKLRNRLSNHLPLVVAMHAQDFYNLADFSYNDAYDAWKKSIWKED